MSFTISGSDGTPISFHGGTFNSVAGDFKVFHSVTVMGPAPNGADSDGTHESTECNDHDYYSRQYSDPSTPSHPLTSNRHHVHCLPPLPAANPPNIHPNGTYNAVGGNMTNLSITSYGENGIDVLFRSVVADALHNSAERPADPACHRGTRNSVLHRLREWAHLGGSGLMWLHGSAGVGKSAIAQTFAASCHEDGILGASFFFKRGNPGCGTWKCVLPTLAYQLATSFPDLRVVIQQAVETDRLVLGQAMRLQFQKLLIAPFEQAPPMTLRPIIVIDGLDECEDRNCQIVLLQLILEGLRGGLPVHFLIASRPEPHLREILEAAGNFGICQGFELRPDASAFTDIRRYLRDEFSRIYKTCRSRGLVLEEGWPGTPAIEHLVKKSSGTFVYASTIVRYVEDEYSHPAERLDSVLRLDPESTAPLDDLYTRILSSFPNRVLLRRVLHAIIRTDVEQLDPEEIDVALQLRRGSSRLALRGLHSLISVPRVRGIGFRHSVALLHASLGDFLVNEARASTLCVDCPTLDTDFVRSLIACLSAMSLDSILFRPMATNLLNCIVRIPPTHDLFAILRNVDIQHVHYSSPKLVSHILGWLKWSPNSPADLIQRWDDLEFISKLRSPMLRLPPVNDPIFNHLYTQILSQNSELLSTLRICTVWPCRLTLSPILDLLGLKWDVLRPLSALRPWVETDWALWDTCSNPTAVDFLCDPIRSKLMDVPRHDILRSTALHCISRIKQILSTNKFFEYDDTWLVIVSQCDACEIVLAALEGVYIAQFCARLQCDPEYHAAWHEFNLHPSSFERILKWLRCFPNPPLHVIESWQNQLVAVEECWKHLPLQPDADS